MGEKKNTKRHSLPSSGASTSKSKGTTATPTTLMKKKFITGSKSTHGTPLAAARRSVKTPKKPTAEEIIAKQQAQLAKLQQHHQQKANEAQKDSENESEDENANESGSGSESDDAVELEPVVSTKKKPIKRIIDEDEDEDDNNINDNNDDNDNDDNGDYQVDKESEIPPVDCVELKKTLLDLRDKVVDVSDQSKDVLQRLDDGDTSGGISFLEAKIQTLLMYDINLVLLMLQKAEGKSLDGLDTVDRLVFLRTVMERIRPIDSRLKYQIDKLVRAASINSNNNAVIEGVVDPLQHKPNPNNMIPKGEGDEEEEQNSGVYQPPKIAATPFEMDDSALAKKEREERRNRQRLARSSMINELRSEISDQPLEITEDDYRMNRLGEKASKRDKVRREYEEENFVRLNVSKKDKSQNRRERQKGTLSSELGHFTELRSFTRDSDNNNAHLVLKKQSMRDRMKQSKRTSKGGKTLVANKRIKGI